MISHDHNFKNIVPDFPRESLDWLLPQVQEHFGELKSFEFVRREPRKRKLHDLWSRFFFLK